MTTHANRKLRLIGIASALLLTGAVFAGCAPARPATEPDPAPPVDYQQQANDEWWDLWMVDYPDAVKPDVDVVREITPSERGSAMATCLSAAGYEGTIVQPDGSIGFALAPEGQEEAQAIATYICHAQYPVSEKYLRPLTPQQFGELYDYWTGELAKCLADHGFEASEEPPSRERYIQENTSLSWNPFNGMYEAMGEEEYFTIAAACPRDPEHIY